jgi:hypothetical protein
MRSLNVVDLTGNLGGGTRFVRALLPAMRRVRPDLDITFLGTEASLGHHAPVLEFERAGIRTRALTYYEGMRWKSQPLRRRLGFKVRRQFRTEIERLGLIRRNFAREIDGADVTYFPWPYFIDVPVIRSAMVATIHDLNFKYFFGSPIFNTDQLRTLDEQMASWLGRAIVTTSSAFMSREIGRFFPGAQSPPVIRLTSFSLPSLLNDGAVPRLPVGVRAPYVLSANNVTVHKNLGAIIAAVSILR